MLKDHPQMSEMQPFGIRVKDVKLSYHVDDVFEKDIPNLLHGNDGLIYTCVNTPYVAGTDPNILKWKPPSENSIDFKLILRFPPSPEQPAKADVFAKPVFELHTWCGGRTYEFWDVMLVKDEEWENMKASGEQFDERIVEVHWDTELEGWRMMRFRDDKPNGNHKNVVENILSSIADGVEKEELLSHSNSIRNAWKNRQNTAASTSAQRAANALQPKPPPPVASALPPPNALALRRFGRLAPSTISKVAGPEVIAGMHR
ncbi:hypothetical protein EIP86_004256 [Pleurotus ostreatoroseus]|nr:hypothetical protein EIP86_004256 [Pleurotus ostreatoroseus]